MAETKHYDLDSDTLLGGASASDLIIPSQKAIKSYVDASTGSVVDQTYDGTSTNAQSGVAIAGELTKYAKTSDIPTSISDLTDDTSTTPIDKADTLTGLTASIEELNYTDGVTSNIQTQIDGKVNKSGDTMTGGLSISESSGAQIKIIHPTEVAGTTPSSEQATGVRFYDKNETLLGYVQNAYSANGSRVTMLNCRNADGSENSNIIIGYNSNGNVYTTAPTPASTSNDTNIATTSFVRKWAYGNVVKKSKDIISSNTSLNGSTDITYNLGSTGYLPSDYTTYPYAVYLSIEGVAGNSVGNYITITLRSALVDNIYVAKCKTYVTNNASLCGWGGWFPVGTDGRIYLGRSTSWNGYVNAFRARAYCRMN